MLVFEEELLGSERGFTPFGVVDPERTFTGSSIASDVGEGRGVVSRSADGAEGRSGEGREGRVDGAVDGRGGSGLEGGALLGGGRLRGRGREEKAGRGVNGRTVLISLSPLPPEAERE